MSGSRDRQPDQDRSQDEIELAAWMTKSQAGDSESYKKLLLRINEMLGKYVRHSFVTLGMASSGGHEDVVQEILLAIHSKRNTFDPSQRFLPWMYAIARYKIVDYVRKNGARLKSSISIEDELENLEVVMSHEVGSELDVIALCDALPAKQREIIRLVKIEGLSISETATRTGYSASDVKVNVHRALKTLKQQIKDSGHENR